MPADLDQFRRENSYRAVVGRKGLVELRHVTANGRRLINKINFETRFGKIKRCLNAADAAADNHHVADIIFCQPRTEPRDLFVFHTLCPHFLSSHLVISSGAALRLAFLPGRVEISLSLRRDFSARKPRLEMTD